MNKAILRKLNTLAKRVFLEEIGEELLQCKLEEKEERIANLKFRLMDLLLYPETLTVIDLEQYILIATRGKIDVFNKQTIDKACVDLSEFEDR